MVKKELESQKKRNITFYESSLLSAASGFIGGIVGTPADIVNVRLSCR